MERHSGEAIAIKTADERIYMLQAERLTPLSAGADYAGKIGDTLEMRTVRGDVALRGTIIARDVAGRRGSDTIAAVGYAFPLLWGIFGALHPPAYDPTLVGLHGALDALKAPITFLVPIFTAAVHQTPGGATFPAMHFSAEFDTSGWRPWFTDARARLQRMFGGA